MVGRKKKVLDIPIDTHKDIEETLSDQADQGIEDNTDTLLVQDTKVIENIGENQPDADLLPKRKRIDDKKDKKKPKTLATMERFIKRREKVVDPNEGEVVAPSTIVNIDDVFKKADSNESIEGGLKEANEQVFKNQKQRKKKAKFAFNTCDITHDNIPVLSDDENIIMQLNIHPSTERNPFDNDVQKMNEGTKSIPSSDERQMRESMFQEDTCFAQDAAHESAKRRVHRESNNTCDNENEKEKEKDNENEKENNIEGERFPLSNDSGKISSKKRTRSRGISH